MTRKRHSIVAFLLTLFMIINLVGTTAVAAPTARATDILENDNQSSGIVLTKGAKPNDDGTVDVTIEAFTTGRVTNTNATTPTDIVLVLDVSGSMEQDQVGTYRTVYGPVNGDDYTRYSDYWWRTFYGFQGSGDYYILVGEEYIPVHKEGYDSNRYDYYISDVTNERYYPILDSSITPDRVESYEVVQFYSARSELVAAGRQKMAVMQEAVNKFLTETASKNAGVTDPAKQHRVSIIKFAGDSYYTSGVTVAGNTAVQNAALSGNIGDNKYNNGNYNYTQVVKGLEELTSVNVNDFTSAVSNLEPGGATAVDYGIELADQVLFNRDGSDVENRKEVVIVFTDGEPTHGSSYSSSVAADAISFAADLKKSNAVVYAISMESHADASVLEAPDYENGNKFMHYLSSNFPNSTASGTTIVPGEGSITSGYYMTPSADMSLEMIFDTIVHQIGAPTISLGADAAVYDHISTYFELNTGAVADDVKVYTSARKSDGTWDTLQPSTATVKTENNNSTIIVSGFDFDENYVSAEPRGANNYGKKLVITIKLKPDYEAVERHKEEIKASGGWVYTNNGNALVEDTHDNIAARVASPAVLMNKVTYLVDSSEYDYAYLMPSDKHTLIAEPTKQGHNFSGWETDDVVVSAGEFIMPGEDVVIEGRFTAKEYPVTYKYNTDAPPAGWPAIPTEYNEVHRYGETVEVKPPLTVEAPLNPDDYDFIGWTPENFELPITDGKFTMPAHGVTFIAHFEPKGGVKYHVEHYLEIIPEVDDETNQIIKGSNYDHAYTDVEDVAGKKFGKVYGDERTGTAGDEVKIAWVNYHGFDKKADPAETHITATVASDLVIKLYYTRKANNVSYAYEPIAGVTMPTAPVDINNPYYYGEEVTVAAAADIEGYKFVGWVRDGSTVEVRQPGDEFVMPEGAVSFTGRYEAGNAPYAVKYYLQNLDGTDYDEAVSEGYTETAKPGDRVSAKIKHFDGFRLVPDHVLGNEDDVVKADGSTVLKVYYDRESYEVRYAWLQPQAEYIVNKPYTLPAPATVKYGATFTVAPKLLASGVEDVDSGTGVKYTFNGWYSQNIDLHPGTVTTDFTMPAHNVTIFGGFNAEEPTPTTTVTYDNDDPDIKEPSQDDTETHEYIIVDPNGGSWTHSSGMGETTYGAGYDPHAVLLMEDHRVLEAAERPGYTFIGWRSTNTRPVGGDPTILSNYDESLTNATVSASDVAHVYVAQYEVIPTPPGGGGGGVSTNYKLTYVSNGGTEYPTETYSSGKVVELTKTPTREGYVFDGWHLNEGLTQLAKSVTMNRNITVYAAWIIAEDEYVQDEDDITSPVPDMLNGDDHIAYVIGYNDGTVRPNSNITRAEVSSIFFRLLKSDIRERNLTEDGPYTDVYKGKWYNTAIATMSRLGILEGIGNEKFAPDKPITRAEFAAICARFDDSEVEAKEDFTDVAGHWAEAEIHEAAARGWIKGYDDKTFRPDMPITRAEAMVLINRVLHRVPKTTGDLLSGMITWPDNTDKSKWYYIAIQEATNSHDFENTAGIYERWTKLIANVDWEKYEK